MKNLLEISPAGIYCPQGDFHIDPWRATERAIITHAHSDHARWGMKSYLAHKDSEAVLRLRLGQDISLQNVEYGETYTLNGVKVSLHPAGHIIGSAQVRVEHGGQIWVVSGDYKLENDGFAAPFEPIKCHTFITESTFGLPVYSWKLQEHIFDEINQWWASNAENGVASLLSGYSLGKAQRILMNLNQEIGPIFTHGAVEATNQALRESGIYLPSSQRVIGTGDNKHKKSDFRRALIIAPPAAIGSAWAKKFEPASVGIASGWMRLRGTRRRRAADRGFVLSDHADWSGLNQAIEATEAEKVYVTHGYSNIYAKWLRDQYNIEAEPLETLFEGELGEINEGSTEQETASVQE